MELYAYGFLLWFGFVALGIVNGTIRNYTYKKIFGDLIAHQISTFTFIIIAVLFIYLFLNAFDKTFDNLELLGLGAFWTMLGIIFEFVFGHYVLKHSWEKLLADYNIFKGRIWILVLLTLLFGPIIIANILN